MEYYKYDEDMERHIYFVESLMTMAHDQFKRKLTQKYGEPKAIEILDNIFDDITDDIIESLNITDELVAAIKFDWKLFDSLHDWSTPLDQLCV